MKSLHLKIFDLCYSQLDFSHRMDADVVLGFRVKDKKQKFELF
jgi:hypothetical protein